MTSRQRGKNAHTHTCKNARQMFLAAAAAAGKKRILFCFVFLLFAFYSGSVRCAWFLFGSGWSSAGIIMVQITYLQLCLIVYVWGAVDRSYLGRMH